MITLVVLSKACVHAVASAASSDRNGSTTREPAKTSTSSPQSSLLQPLPLGASFRALASRCRLVALENSSKLPHCNFHGRGAEWLIGILFTRSAPRKCTLCSGAVSYWCRQLPWHCVGSACTVYARACVYCICVAVHSASMSDEVVASMRLMCAVHPTVSPLTAARFSGLRAREPKPRRFVLYTCNLNLHTYLYTATRACCRSTRVCALPF